MFNTLKVLICLSFLVIADFYGGKFSYAKEKYIVSFDDWPPFTAASRPYTGLSSFVMTALSDEERVFEYRKLPWVRIERELELGKIDAAYPFALTENRKNRFYYTSSVIELQSKIYTLVGNKSVSLKGIKSNGLAIGVVGGSFMEGFLNSKGYKTIRIKNSQKLMDMLLRGRIYFISEDPFVVRKLLHSKSNSLISNHEVVELNDSPFPAMDNVILISKKSNLSFVIPKINERIKEFRASNIYRCYLMYHGIQSFKGSSVGNSCWEFISKF